MSPSPMAHAELRREKIERVRLLIQHLRALLAGELTRDAVQTWLLDEQARAGRRGPFPSQPALCVYESLLSLDERWGDDFVVREVELRAYLRWLTEGESFRSDGDALIALDRNIEEFAAQTGTEAARVWVTGLGWWLSFQFGSPASGRAYVVLADLESPGRVGLHSQVDADRNDAIVDLFEVLAIDERDVEFIHPGVELERLPVWALWREDDNCNRFEIDRFRSYTKAYAQQQLYDARGHRQTYWVEPAG
ncbi:MAG: hypothetical protein R3A79_21445 [Nannocystaceae bacterium]